MHTSRPRSDSSSGGSLTSARHRHAPAIRWLLPMLIPVLAAAQTPPRESGRNTPPTYPIDPEVRTTLEEMVVTIALPVPATPLVPRQVAQYAANGYGVWNWSTPGLSFLKPDLQTDNVPSGPSVADPAAATLVSFFTISDVHITDKESPTQLLYLAENYPDPMTPAPNPGPSGNSSCYSGVMLSTTHVLDAAVQTINAIHQTAPFDCGIALGDAANSTQYNELRWYIDVLDGQWITPSSGKHLGATTTEYQKPSPAAGLDKSIPWYQAIGNHDQFWLGSSKVTPALRKTYVGSDILNIGPFPSGPPDFNTILNTRGFYMGVINGLTEFGEIIGDGPTASWDSPPQIVADPQRRSLLMKEWMDEFRKTTSNPLGHGFTKQMIQEEFACYHFYPKADVPLKVIVFDDTDKLGCGAAAELDAKRYNWLVKELDAGEKAGELMVVCSHIPIRPYAQNPSPASNTLYPKWSLFSPIPPISPISEDTLLDKLHTYKNLILWVAGHVHRNAITPQPAKSGDPQYGFWEVETPSLRDFPQQFRRFNIVRNSDNTISIFALDVDTAVAEPLAGQTPSPAWTSRSYAIAAQEIYGEAINQAPHIDARSGVYNAELVKQLSPAMAAKIALVSPVVSSFNIRIKTSAADSTVVTLENTITGTTPTHYMASESSAFSDAEWLPYSKSPDFSVSTHTGKKTLYFKVKDGSGRESAVVHKQVVFSKGRIIRSSKNDFGKRGW